jgi:hypothetical protein
MQLKYNILVNLCNGSRGSNSITCNPLTFTELEQILYDKNVLQHTSTRHKLTHNLFSFAFLQVSLSVGSFSSFIFQSFQVGSSCSSRSLFRYPLTLEIFLTSIKKILSERVDHQRLVYPQCSWC